MKLGDITRPAVDGKFFHTYARWQQARMFSSKEMFQLGTVHILLHLIY